jgi:membrane protein DedA with SNARE-associated domain
VIDAAKEFIFQHQQLAPIIVFLSLLLAGMNIPISIDIMLVLTAFFTATTSPDHYYTLYISLLLGTYFSAWISYWIGRVLGNRLRKTRFFFSILSEKKVQKMKTFYEKYGFWSLLIGRYIPFGVRNCLFMTTGLSRSRFGQFIIRDLAACIIWVTSMWLIFIHLSKNLENMLSTLKSLQITLFFGISVTVIGGIWYKIKKKRNRREYP